MRGVACGLLLALAAACGGPPKNPPIAFTGEEIPAELQRAGDPVAGYRALVNNGYVSCGIPYSLYSQVFGPAAPAEELPGREGRNATLPYYFTSFTTSRGVEVVTANCLACHAGKLYGRVFVGLGDANADFTGDPAPAAQAAGRFLTDPNEQAEWQKWVDRVVATAPFIQTLARGVTAADDVAAVLFSHRDAATLAWSNTPLLELPPTYAVPVDVPPWWRMKKKTSMFYSAAGRGDHARIMMTASTLCTDSVDEARAMEAYFADIRAYIASLEPLPYPGTIDAPLAERGRQAFERECSRCHGTYGPNGVYPNRLISADDVGTDPVLALGAAQFADRYIDWFRRSFYGETARLEPKKGYLAPPLDGIWATAPYLHNGSIPDLVTLLDSSKRPRYFARSFDSNDYDQSTLGWKYTALDHGHAGETDAAARASIYDTTELGYSNEGHVFGDALTTDERAAVLEYLKTL
jgi:mono/diheme cytochrome c family protein